MEKNEKLTLKDFLATLGENDPVAIGASDGSGWLCFTKAGDLDGIQAAFDTYYKGEQIKLQERQARLYRLITQPPTMTGDQAKNWEIVLRRVKSITELMPMIETAQKYLDDYTPPLERVVAGAWEKYVDAPCLGIAIEGTETGFWTRSEAGEV